MYINDKEFNKKFYWWNIFWVGGEDNEEKKRYKNIFINEEKKWYIIYILF